MSKKILLKSLKLKNFKGIKELDLSFDKITNIYGDNGTGKTSVFDAFTWLLFDKDSSDRKDFEIKTLDQHNNVLHGLEHEVTGILLLDGKSITLTKVYKEKWQKKRGEAERQLTGHETLYYVNEVPVKKSEYQEQVNNLIDEQLFKLISNPLYFSNMKWQERRNVILEIIGDISADRVTSYKSNLKALERLLEDKDIDTLKKSIAARKRKLNDDIKSIPYRIDECNNSIIETDFEALEFRKREIVSEIKSTEEQLLDSSKVTDEILKQKDKLYEFKSKLKDIEYKAKDEAQKPLKNLNNQLGELDRELYSIQRKTDIVNNQINLKSVEIYDIEKKIVDLREKWNSKNQETLLIEQEEFICPTCKRAFETEDIEAKRHQMEENFNLNKARELAKINGNGKELKVRLEKLKEEIEIDQSQAKELNCKFNEVSAEKDDVQKSIDEFVPIISFDSNEEYQYLKSQIEKLQFKLSQPQEVKDKVTGLKNKKLELEKQLEEINKKLSYKEQNEKLKARISELEDEEKVLAQQIAELEGQEFLCEEFIKTKVELLESSINNKFKFVRFKLFHTLVNGAVEECCEALIDGVPFGNANTASQINAGLDIINALSEYYDVSAPIFIDNRESVNKIVNCNSQIINLIVSKDKILKVESLESEVA